MMTKIKFDNVKRAAFIIFLVIIIILSLGIPENTEISKSAGCGGNDDELLNSGEEGINNQDAEGAKMAVASKDNLGIYEGVSVRKFGAKGDGKADDANAIQKAIDFVYKRGGGKVLLPAGVYLISKSIDVTCDLDISVTLKGVSRLTSVIKPSKDSFRMILLDHGARAEDLSIDGNGKKDIDAIAPYSSRADVNDVYIKNVRKAIDLTAQESYGGLYNNSFYRIYIKDSEYGVYIETVPSESGKWNPSNVNSVNANFFYAIQINSAKKDAVYINGGNGNIFYGGDIEGNNFGVRILNGNSNSFMGTWFEMNNKESLFVHVPSESSPELKVSSLFITIGGGDEIDHYAGRVITSGEISSGSDQLIVSNSTNIYKNKYLSIEGAGQNGSLIAYVKEVSGNTVTLSEKASATVTNGAVLGPYFSGTQSVIIQSGQQTHILGSLEIDRARIGASSTSSYYGNEILGGYRAFPISNATGVHMVSLSPNVKNYYIKNEGESGALLNLSSGGNMKVSGDVEAKGSIKFGDGDPIKGHLFRSLTWYSPKVAVNSFLSKEWKNFSGAELGDTLSVAFNQNLPDGVMLSGAVVGDDTVRISLFNMTPNQVSFPEVEVKVNLWKNN